MWKNGRSLAQRQDPGLMTMRLTEDCVGGQLVRYPPFEGIVGQVKSTCMYLCVCDEREKKERERRVTQRRKKEGRKEGRKERKYP